MAVVLLSLNPLAALALIAGQRAVIWSGAQRPAGWVRLAAWIGFVAFSLSPLVLDGWDGGALALVLGGGVLVLPVVLRGTAKTGTSTPLGRMELLASSALLALPVVVFYLAPGVKKVWWTPHDNAWAAFAVMAVCSTIVLYPGRLRQVAMVALLTAAFVVVLATGSRTGLMGLIAGALAIILFDRVPRRWSRSWLAILLFGFAVLGALSYVSPLSSRLAGLWSTPGTNSLLASEEISGELWTKRGVAVEALNAKGAHASFRVVSDSGDPLDRVHQRVFLAPGDTRTLTVEFQDEPSSGGIVAFSDSGGRLRIPLSAEYAAEQLEPPTLVRVERRPLTDGWRELSFTVVNEAAEPVIWRVGIAPALVEGVDGGLVVRHIRLNEGHVSQPYEPTFSTDRVTQLAKVSSGQRLGYARGAWALFLRRPLFGYGSAEPFYKVAEAARVDIGQSSSNRAAHAHSLVGDLLVRSGLSGLIGLGLMLFALVASIARERRYKLIPLLVVIGVLGLGDATFFSGGGPFILATVAMYLGDFGGTRSPRSRRSGILIQ